MKASIVAMRNGHPFISSRPESPVLGMRLPYLTRMGIPVFMLDTDDPSFRDDDVYVLLDALPGMVGIAQNGNVLYVIDADGEVLPLSVTIQAKLSEVRSG